MRKYFLSLVALAAGLFATSCQESIVEPQIAGPTTFTVQLPDAMGTKADPTLGSAANVNQLFVAVYADASANDATPIYRTVAEVSEGKATVQLNLIQGQLYDVVFWAQVGDNYVSSEKVNNEYNFDLVNIPMNKNYHNTDAGAAFFYYWDNFQPTGTSQPVTLRRPFAQLNLGTTAGSLTNNAGTFTLQSSVIKVKGIADNFNTVSGFGTVTEANKEKVYTFIAEDNYTVSTSLPLDQTIKVAGVDYKYVSMDYLPIVGDDQALITVDATITLSNNQSINHKFTNVPVRENYRTNIVGNLISSTTDFNVVVDDRFVDENGDNVSDDNNSWVVENTAAAQAALDNAKSGDVIRLVAGVNYGTLIFRKNSSSTVVDITDAGGDAPGNEKYRRIENLTIIGAEGAIVDGFDFQVGWIPGSGASYIDINNLKVEGVTFSGKQTVFNFEGSKGSALGIDGLNIVGCKMTDADNNNRFVFQQISGYKELSDKATGEYVMTAGVKNLTISGCEVIGAYQVIESRAMHNLVITDNTFKGIKARDMLITSDVTYHPDKTYTGNITITGNTSVSGEERFVRASLNNSDAVVVIKDNTIIDYQGTDADYIKVTDGTNVTIENNKLIKSNTVTVPANNTEVVLDGGNIEVTVPASVTSEGDEYKIEVSDENTTTDPTTGETSVSFNLTMYKNDAQVSSDGTTIYEVAMNVGPGKIISSVTHNGTDLTQADTKADQTYNYDSATGVLTIYTKSFSPFAVTYADYKDYVRTKNFFYGSYIGVSTGKELSTIVGLNPQITKYSVFEGDTRITDAVTFRFSNIKKETISENSYKVSVHLAILDDKGEDLELKPGMPIPINEIEYLHVYMNLIDVPAGYSVSGIKVNDIALTKTTNSNPGTGGYLLGIEAKDVYFQSTTAGLIEVTLTK